MQGHVRLPSEAQTPAHTSTEINGKWEMGNFWKMRAEAFKTEASHESFMRAA